MSDADLSTPDKYARIAELEAALAAAHADISARDILIDTLRVQIARLKRMQFGKSSEKLDTQIAQLELALEALEGEAIVAAVRRGDPVAVDQLSPVRALPAHLPREEQRIEPEQGSCTEPQAYIADVIAKIAGNWPAAQWDELIPWNWQENQQQVAQAA